MRAMGARNQAARGRVVLRYAVAASERRPPDRPFEVARLHDLLHGRQIASMTPKNEPNDRASQANVAAAHSSVAWLRLCCALLLRGRPGLSSCPAPCRATKEPQPVAPRINKRIACSDRGADCVVQSPHCTRLFCMAAQGSDFPSLARSSALCKGGAWAHGPAVTDRRRPWWVRGAGLSKPRGLGDGRCLGHVPRLPRGRPRGAQQREQGLAARRSPRDSIDGHVEQNCS